MSAHHDEVCAQLAGCIDHGTAGITMAGDQVMADTAKTPAGNFVQLRLGELIGQDRIGHHPAQWHRHGRTHVEHIEGSIHSRSDPAGELERLERVSLEIDGA